MVNFLRSPLFMYILVGVITVTVVILLAIKISTHDEPGLMPESPRWERSGFPLSVCPHAYVEDDHEAARGARNATDNVIDALNTRLGFAALRADYADEHCDIRATFGVPAEPGWMDPGGDALLTTGSGGVSCDVRISNVFGEMLTMTLEHEMGHCLGLAHDDFETSIMRPMQRPTPDRAFPPWITDHDRALLREMYAPR